MSYLLENDEVFLLEVEQRARGDRDDELAFQGGGHGDSCGGGPASLAAAGGRGCHRKLKGVGGTGLAVVAGLARHPLNRGWLPG